MLLPKQIWSYLDIYTGEKTHKAILNLYLFLTQTALFQNKSNNNSNIKKVSKTWPQWNALHCGIESFYVADCYSIGIERIVSNMNTLNESFGSFPESFACLRTPATMIYAHCQAFSAQRCSFSILMISACDSAWCCSWLCRTLTAVNQHRQRLQQLNTRDAPALIRTAMQNTRPKRQKVCCQAFWI